jgi:putative ABC transport system permease protein
MMSQKHRMAGLNNQHIDYIRKDLHYRGVVADQFQDEVIDHFCSAVETEMDQGRKFIDAYQEVLRRFGHTGGLRKTQQEVIRAENSTAKLMLKNHLKIAWRTLAKHRFFTFINIAGLAIGITACLMISLYIRHELSYDTHFNNAARIYRMNTEILFNGNHYDLACTPPAAARAMAEHFPEVEATVHFRQWAWRWVRRGTDSFKEPNMAYASQGIFTVFSIPLLTGNTAHALVEPNTLVISKTKADQYFAGEQALDQTLIIDNISYKITGVFNDLPEATHFKLDFILSTEGLDDSKSESWLSNFFYTYILLREGASAPALEAKLPSLVDQYVGPEAKAFFGKKVLLNQPGGDKFVYSLIPVTDIHLRSDRTMEMSANSDITYVYLFGAVALFILAIACINFMNLSTARSANRAKEVGVRKVMGSLRTHLVRQFLTESILLSFFSFLLAVGLTYLLLPAFNALAERALALPFTDPVFLMVMTGAALVVGILAGLYPSFFLSAFKPVQVLKGKAAPGMKSGAIRSSLVVFQFMISIILIIGTITVQKQLAFIQNKKLGYAKDQVIVLHNTETLGTQQQAFRNELLENPVVINASVSGFLPISGWARNEAAFWLQGKQPAQDNHYPMQSWAVDHNYVPTMGMRIKEGRNFSLDFPADSTAIIINESALKRFGFKNPIGEKIVTFAYEPGAFDARKYVTLTIIGVVEDFHFESLKQNIAPLGLHMMGSSNWSMPVRFESKNTADVVDHLKKTWEKFNPGKPFVYNFLDEVFGNTYRAEQRLGNIFGIFAALAIIIACLGLFALSAFTAEQRTKEIGIRKVLGASVTSIVFLLSKEFGKLIAIAFVIATPLAWYAVEWWLQNYEYKIDIGVMVYLLAGAGAFVVAWITMGVQSVKAARGNPVEALRSE